MTWSHDAQQIVTIHLPAFPLVVWKWIVPVVPYKQTAIKWLNTLFFSLGQTCSSTSKDINSENVALVDIRQFKKH